MLAPPHWHFRDTRERLEAHMGGPQNQDERWLREMGVRPPIFIRWIGSGSDTTMTELTEGKNLQVSRLDLFNTKHLEIAQATGRPSICRRWQFCNMYHIAVLWHFSAQWPSCLCKRDTGGNKPTCAIQKKRVGVRNEVNEKPHWQEDVCFEHLLNHPFAHPPPHTSLQATTQWIQFLQWPSILLCQEDRSGNKYEKKKSPPRKMEGFFFLNAE